MGDLFLATLRWSVKEERGCTDPLSWAYKPTATVNDVSSQSIGIGKNGFLDNNGSAALGKLSVTASGLGISILKHGFHSFKVTRISGQAVYMRSGTGMKDYRIAGIKSGTYLAWVEVNGAHFKKRIAIP